MTDANEAMQLEFLNLGGVDLLIERLIDPDVEVIPPRIVILMS